MGRYLCWIAPRLDADLQGDRRVLIAADYRTSHKKANDAGEMPAKNHDYAARIARHLKKHTAPGGK